MQTGPIIPHSGSGPSGSDSQLITDLATLATDEALVVTLTATVARDLADLEADLLRYNNDLNGYANAVNDLTDAIAAFKRLAAITPALAVPVLQAQIAIVNAASAAFSAAAGVQNTDNGFLKGALSTYNTDLAALIAAKNAVVADQKIITNDVVLVPNTLLYEPVDISISILTGLMFFNPMPQ